MIDIFRVSCWAHLRLKFTDVLKMTSKSLAYMQNEWVYLARYIDCGELEIDNNIGESATKPFAVGRKNWMFAEGDRVD